MPRQRQINLKTIKDGIDSILTQTEEIKTKITDREYKKLLDTLKIVNDLNNKLKPNSLLYCDYKIHFVVKCPLFIPIRNTTGYTIKIYEEKLSHTFISKKLSTLHFQRLINFTLTKKDDGMFFSQYRLPDYLDSLLTSIKSMMLNTLLGFKTEFENNCKVETTISITNIQQLNPLDEISSDSESDSD